MTGTKRLAIVMFILTLSLIIAGNVWSSIYVNKDSAITYIPHYESFILAVSFMLLSIYSNMQNKYSYINGLFLYFIFLILQILTIWDILIGNEIWIYFSIVIFLSSAIGYHHFFKKFNYSNEIAVTHSSKVLSPIFLLFLFELSFTLFIFLQLDSLKNIELIIQDLTMNLLPMNFIISMVCLCGALLIIKFSLKVKIKDFLTRIGVFSMRDLKTGLLVFISTILFLQIADIVLNLYMEHSFFRRYYYYHNFIETRILPMIDMFAVGLHEEIVFRGLLFYIIWYTIGKNKKWTMSPVAVILLSQVLFSLTHLPNMLLNSDRSTLYIGYELARLFIFGIFFVMIYIKMSSIYAAIFIHTLFNYYGSPIYSGSSLTSSDSQTFIIILYVMMLLLFWNYFPNLRDKSRFNKIQSGYVTNSDGLNKMS